MLGQRRRRWPSIISTLVQCVVFAGTCHIRAFSRNKIHRSNGGPMLGHRLRLLPSIDPTSDPRLAFARLVCRHFLAVVKMGVLGMRAASFRPDRAEWRRWRTR